MRPPSISSPSLRVRCVVFAILVLSACGVDTRLTGPPSGRRLAPPLSEPLAALNCTATVREQTLSCESPAPISAAGVYADIIGGQNINVRLASSSFSYDGTSLYQFDVTIQNLLNEALGTPDGAFVDTAGIKVFFFIQPIVTIGTGTITILNADGSGTFLGANEPFYRYPGTLVKDAVSAPKTWQFDVPSTVAAFTFTVFLAATVQPLLVINEVLVNPGGVISDANGEWFEIYNAGTRSVDIQGYVINDSAASGARPPHAITASLIVPSGGYVVLAPTTNTTNNGGVPVDYAYTTGILLQNSLDRLQLQRVFGADTLTIDETIYASAAISAQNGVSRELKNPLLPNLDLDGSNWADALVSAVYGPGGRGTPKAQNSTFVP
jgi:hypothetical protein